MKKNLLRLIPSLVTLLSSLSLYAQTADGNAGLNQANTTIRGYFDAATNLMYAIGAIMGVIGALRVYDRIVNAHSESGKIAAAWLGGCIFLVLSATVVRSFFGL